jgi:hypothetical protein
MKYVVEITSCGMTYIQSFTKTGTGIQEILSFCITNLKDCDAGITRHSKVGGEYTYKHTAR